VPLEEIDRMQDEIAKHPRNAKVKLAYAIVGRYHGHQVAVWEREWFEHTISKGLVPEDIPTLSVSNPRMTVLELVALARQGESKSDTRRLIQQGGVELNKEKKKDPKENLLLQTNDILQVGKRNWYRIQVTRPNEFDTEALEFSSLKIADLDLVQRYLPDWELAKYLSLPLGKEKEVRKISREVIKRVIMQPEPKHEFLWKIQDKKFPDRTIGIAHLGLDENGDVRQNVWLDPAAVHNESLMQEAVNAINEFAFQSLGLRGAVLQKAFALASSPTELSQMQMRFLMLDAAARNRDMPDGAMWGMTKDGWEDMKSWWNKYRPQPQKPEPPKPIQKVEPKPEPKPENKPQPVKPKTPKKEPTRPSPKLEP